MADNIDATQNSPKPTAAGWTRRRALIGAAGVATAAAIGGGIYLGQTDVGAGPGKSRARLISSSANLPAAVDVVVIGGGIVGSATALFLAERGISVALCEKGVIAGEASGRAMGFIDSQLADPIKFPLLARNQELWRGINARIGLDTGYRDHGLLMSLGSEEMVEGVKAWLAIMRQSPGLAGEIIGQDQLAKILPGMVDVPRWALHSPNDGSVEPQLAAPAIAQAAMAKGASILQQCAVRGIETKAGRVSGVVTERGPISCGAVVLAGGYWSPMMLRSLGLSHDQFDIHLSMMKVSAQGGPKTPLSADGFGFRPMLDGNYSIGVVDFAAPITPTTIRNIFKLGPAAQAFSSMAHPGLSPGQFWDQLTASSTWPLDRPSPFEVTRVLVPNFRGGPIATGAKALKTHFPAFNGMRPLEQWAGVISTTLDNLPTIGAVQTIPGLFVGSGFSYGLTYGLGAAEAIADLIQSKQPGFDLSPYRFERFSDGSDIAFHA